MTNSFSLDVSILAFDPDLYTQPAVAFAMDVEKSYVEQPMHQHKKGQLLLTIKGSLTCTTEKAIWLSPPQHAIWIPKQTQHCNQASQNAEIYFLFVDSATVALPMHCCTLEISPLIREGIKYLSVQDQNYSAESPTAHVVQVLLEQLNIAPEKQLLFPISDHPKIKHFAQQLIQEPSNRMPLIEWAKYFAMSERSLARLVKQHTGLSFGRWRQQLHLIIALNELSEGESVQGVAGHLGYDSVNAFITMFKKALGSTPSHFFEKLK